MKNKKNKVSVILRPIAFVIFLVITFSLPVFKADAANACSSNGTGNFNVAATWTNCGGTTPQAADTITINNGHTVTLVATTAVAGITINSGGVLAANTRTVNDSGNFTDNGSYTGTTSSLNLTSSNPVTINGNGSYSPTSAVTISNENSVVVASGSHLSFSRITVDEGTLTNNSTAGLTVLIALSGGGQITQGANAILNISGTSGITTLSAVAVGNVVNYNGPSVQTVHVGTYQTLNVNTNTSNSVNITADTTVNTSLNLGATKITTSTNKIILSAGANLVRTTGYIIGNLQKNVATGATSRTFEVGSINAYTPVVVNFGNVTVAGNLTVSTTATDHPNISTSGLFADKTINRYWTLTNSGIVFNNYNATFNFVPGDVDVGVNLGNIILKQFSSGVWTKPTLGTTTSTSVQGTGITTFGDFAIGQHPITNVTSTLASGVYTNPKVIDIEVNFAENVFVTGVPQIALNSGGTASYVSGSGTPTLTFNYTVQPGDSSAKLDYVDASSLTLNGGTIKDINTNNVDLKLDVPGADGSLSANKNIIIDTVLPTITITAPTKLFNNTITDTTFQINDNIGVNSSDVSVDASNTVGQSNLVCVQTTSKKVDCTINITGSGNLVIKALDLAGNVATQTESGYVITTATPIITINAPTKVTNATITNTTIHITDDHGVTTSNVVVDSSTTITYNNFSCLQTDANTVDCTINITGSGNLVIKATDNATNAITQAENGYVIDLDFPNITITAPTKLSNATITNTTIHVTDGGASVSSFNVVLDSLNTAGVNNFVCTQTSATTVDCTLHITDSGNLVVKATDVGGNVSTKTESGYVVDIIAPVVAITAPLKTSQTPITNTTIHITDNNAILATNVTIDSATNLTYSSFNCTQTDGKTVDCTININSSGNLVIDAVDAANNSSMQNENQYVIDPPGHSITINAPTKISNTNITNTTIHVVDEDGILVSGVNADASTVSFDNFNCTQTDSMTVDCTINIKSSGDLTITDIDSLNNLLSITESNYVVDPSYVPPSTNNGSYVGIISTSGGHLPVQPVVQSQTINQIVSGKTCLPYLTKYISRKGKNSVSEVKKLQKFLRDYEGFSTLKITGVYNTTTYNAVKKIQAKYFEDILEPWGFKAPTGIVNRTTVKKINELYCSF